MCDTIAIVSDGQVTFAKNSDRDPNEAQLLDWRPRETHSTGATLRCTQIEIPQVTQTWAVLLSRPFWMWGAEMGANEHGLVIGNESVFTRESPSKSGLTGMDLLRLALERARTADDAIEVITKLLVTHGQGGNCGFENPNFTYNNSYIIADRYGARVLETAGKEWAVEIIEGARSISNGLTIPGFAEAHTDRFKTAVSACKIRQPRTQQLATGASDLGAITSILRDHGGANWPTYRRLNGTLAMACMHGGSEIASSLTTGSWISVLNPNSDQHWVTATSSPCLSLFKPVKVEHKIDLHPSPSGTADESLWWTHEKLHRRVLQDPVRLSGSIVAERDALEAEWFADPPDSQKAFTEHQNRLLGWLDQVENNSVDVRPRFVRRYWQKRDRLASADHG